MERGLVYVGNFGSLSVSNGVDFDVVEKREPDHRKLRIINLIDFRQFPALSQKFCLRMDGVDAHASTNTSFAGSENVPVNQQSWQELVVFQCEKCKNIIGDSSSWVTATASLRTISLSSD